ncbi:MAG: tetratricopeptide repeat protein [Bacteroidota bacterium]
MKKAFILLTVFTIGLLTSCNQSTQKNNRIVYTAAKTDNPILGKWVRIGHTGPISFDFKENGIIEGDFGNDQTIEIVSEYKIVNDTINFLDKEGKMCQGTGSYKIYKNDYYLAFDLVDDNCNGRIKTTMGFWTKPNFKELLEELDKKISNSPNTNLYLNRARLYMAIGTPKKAKSDFDIYLESDTTNARVYINRAGTRFPDDMKGVVFDCNKAIDLDSNNKNAYFLRGLALYQLGEKKQACEDFSKAIELGFSILRIAEQEKCAEFWIEEE